MRLVAVGQEQHYLCASRPATVESSVGMCPGMSAGVVWERIELPYERIALRTPHGRFLSCQVEDGRPRMTLSEELGPQEAFVEVLWPDGEVSLRTCEMTYVAVSGSDAEPVSCSGVDTGPQARFRYVEPPGHLRARAEDIVERQPQVPDMPRQFAHTGEEVRGPAKGHGQG
jgi:hypothetical protein